MIRNCLYCVHCEFDGGSRGYSEMTPGDDMRLRCEKGKWDAFEESGRKRLVELLEKAKDCKSFVADNA